MKQKTHTLAKNNFGIDTTSDTWASSLWSLPFNLFLLVLFFLYNCITFGQDLFSPGLHLVLS